MIDLVAPGRSSASFQAAKLADQSRIIEQANEATVEDRQRIAVNVALRLVRQLVENALIAEWLTTPLASKTVADHDADAIGLQRIDEFGSHI